MGNLKAAKKSAILLLCVLLVLLAISFLPFGSEKSLLKEKTILLQQIQELNNLPPSVDAKIEPAVKEQIKDALFAAATAEKPEESREKKKTEFIVKSSEPISDEVRKIGGKVLDDAESIDGNSMYSVVVADADRVAGLAAEEKVARIIPNTIFYATLDESVPLIKAEAFWNAGYRGNGVKVAVVDSGVDETHPLLQGKVAAEKDFTKSGNSDDICGHGTHVAGIIAGTKASGGLYDGVAPGAGIISVKALTRQPDGSCGGEFVNMLEGIKWALDPDANPATDDGAKVISMSLGAPFDITSYTDFDNELKAVVAKGVVIVVSSGNCGNGCPDTRSCGSFRSVTFPGSSSNVITVGAVDKAKNVACFSSGENVAGVGIKPDFAAPGKAIKSSIPGGGYASWDGTSMAAPHVSGAAALMLGKSPQLRQDDVRRVLEKTALDLGDVGKDTSYGFGLIDLAKAFAYKEGLEVKVELEQQVISGSAQKITVRVYDDVTVNSVKAIITKPNNAKADVTFSSTGSNTFTYDFADTALMGNYVVDAAVNYGGTSGSSGTGSEGGGEPGSDSSDISGITVTQTAYFKVTSLTGDFGNVEEISIPQQQKLSSNLTGTLKFANTAAVELNFSALLQLLDNLTVVQEIGLQPVTVAANFRATATINNALEVGPGNYTLRILTDYGAGSLVNETNITVTDDLAPQALGIDYRKSIKVNDAQVITVQLYEHQKVIAGLRLDKHDGQTIKPITTNYTTKLVSEFGNNKSIAITIYNGSDLMGGSALNEGTGYTATLQLCDESGNCFGSLDAPRNDAEFSITGCVGKHVLIVKTFDEKSVFEEAAAANSNTCLSALDKSISGTPPASYLEKFDAVVWTTGTDLVNIDSSDAAVLTDYYGKKGKIVVEGSDVAFRHGTGDFMRYVLHSELKTDLGFTVTSVANMSNLSINITRQHPIVHGLSSPLPFNATVDPFPDAIAAANGGVELAKWSGLDTSGAAAVVYESEDGKTKSLLLPFSVDALNEEMAESLAANSLEWLLGEAGMDIMPARLSHDFLVEGRIQATAVIQSSEQLQATPIIDVFVDGELASSSLLNIASPSSSQPWEYDYQFEATLGPGQHTVAVVANSGFSIKESNYVNNHLQHDLTVYPKEADLLLPGMAYSYDDGIGALIVNLSVSNFGGTAAASAVKAYLDGKEKASASVELSAGETKQVKLELNSQKGTYDFKAALDPDDKVQEHNESNNELRQKIYLCSKAKVLVVNDNDAAFFSTPEPSSADEFMRILRNSGYCVESWDEKQQGAPGIGKLGNFKAVVWTTGDYFNGTISNEDAMAIGNYSGGLLLEGSDIGLDSSGNELLQSLMAAAFSSDMLLNESQNESLALKSHSITANVTALNISKEKSPYPDAIDAVSEEVAAEWQSGKAAITARTIISPPNSRKQAYYAFSVDGITDAAAMEKLVTNTVEWLLDRPNSPPQISNITNLTFEEISAAAINVTMNEGQARNFSVLAEDPDGDPLTYMWLLNSSLVSDKYYFAFSPKYNESGSYNLTVIVSDGQAEAKAELLITMLDTMECDPARQTRLCQLQFGVCTGSNVTCSTAGKWPGCTAATYFGYSSRYEAVESSCDGLDNDCDGKSDEGFGDVDGDEIADCVDKDNDNDDVEDDEDDLVGNETSINFTGDAGDEKKLKIRMEDSEDEKEKAQKVKKVRINHSDKPLLQFNFNFSKGNIQLRNLTIEKQKNSSKEGFTLVRGLNLQGGTKQVYVDRLIAGSNAVCVKDKEVLQITEVSSNCDSEGESLLTCKAAGTEPAGSGLACRLTSENSQFQIFGLKHSAVMEACTDADLDTYLPVGCSGGLDCNDGNSSISPAAAEVCNGVDDNCNGQVDENRACNTAPQLQSIGNKTAEENKTLTFTIAATDSEGDSLAYNATSLPAGASFDNATAAFSWMPTFMQSGAYAVTFNVSDSLLHDYETINVTVANTNRAPVFEKAGNKTVLENAELSFTVSVTDPDGDSLAQLFANVPEKLGSAEFSLATRKFKWTPTFDDSGSYTIWFTASDGQLSTNEFANVTVVNVNRAPRFENLTNSTVLENSTLKFFVNASDPDKDSLTVTLVVEIPAKFPGSAAFDGRKFALPLGFEDAGSYSATFSASDGQATIDAIANFTVANVNRAPSISGVSGNLTVNETEKVTAAVSASDADEDALTYSLNDSRFTQPSPGSFEWQTDFSSAGAYVVLATASDGSATAQFAFAATVKNVNRAPRFENVTNQTVFENSTLLFFANATDPDNDWLQFTVEIPPELAAAEFSSGKMELSWQPTFEDSGSYSVTFKANDSQYSAVAEANITVLNTNRAPEAKIGLEPPGYYVNESEFRLLRADAFDPDNDHLEYTWWYLGNADWWQQGKSKLLTKYKSVWFFPNYTDGDGYNVHKFLLNVSDGNATVNATVDLVVVNTQGCKPKDTEKAPCGMAVGACKQGQKNRTCGSDFKWSEWGECLGEVKPAPKDDCGTLEDEDCDGIVNNGCGNSPDLATTWMSWKLYDTGSDEIPTWSIGNASVTMRPYLYGEVLNIGSDDSPPALMAWYLNGRLMARTQLPRLNASEKAQVFAYMPYAPYEGMNNISLIADADNKIREESEKNNQISFPIEAKYNETHKQWAKQYGEDYYTKFPTQEECENQGKCW